MEKGRRKLLLKNAASRLTSNAVRQTLITSSIRYDTCASRKCFTSSTTATMHTAAYSVFEGESKFRASLVRL